SYWLSVGVLNWSERAFGATLFFTLVLLSNALFFGFLAFTKLGEPFYAAASAVQSRGAIFGHWDWFRRWQNNRGRTLYGEGELESRDVDHAFCVSTVFIGRKTRLDRRHGSARPGACRQNEVCAYQFFIACAYTGIDLAVVPHVKITYRYNAVFCRFNYSDDVC